MSEVLQQSPRFGELGAANLTVAVAGNPNSGKTTLFNALTGLSQKVANYPGVTVEKVVGICRLGSITCRVLDVPGTYSLTARSLDEAIAAAALLGHHSGERRPDAVVVVVDATNIERGLYLISQILELGIPTVIALNMYDVALRRGIRIDHRSLSAGLGVPVVPMVAHRGEGLPELRAALVTTAAGAPPQAPFPLPAPIEEGIGELQREVNGNGYPALARPEAIRLLLDDQPILRDWVVDRNRVHLKAKIDDLRGRLADTLGNGGEVRLRTEWAAHLADRVVERPTDPDASWTSRIDRWVLHRVWGPVIMVVLMVGIFQSIFSWAQPLMEFIDVSFGRLATLVGAGLPAGPLRSLMQDGVIGGVGSVLIFLPQILILFFFIGLLEDSGYMPRAAFLVDRIFKGCGLSGRSFIPLLSSFACAVPGIMATRTIDNRRQRFLTIAVAPLMTCSARLPVYAILIAAFVPSVYIAGFLNLQGLTLAVLYLLGILVAAIVAIALKHTVLRGPAASFVMELPSYKIPKWSNIWLQMMQRGRAFVVRAGTVILALTIVLWALSYYPRSEATLSEYADRMSEAAPAQRARLEAELDGALLRESFLGRFGRMLEPASMHLGWDWKITMAVLASFPAREVLIATLGTIYNLGPDSIEKEGTLVQKLRHATWDHGPRTGQPVFNIAVAASVMVFFALCCQCMATLATIRRETNSWRWPVFVFSYMTAIAVLGAYVTYHLGLQLGLGGAL
jgi:ferrous iron transport protein B